MFRNTIRGALALLATVGAFPAFGFSFVPTELEFAAWPDYCRARYVETVVGRIGAGSSYASKVSSAEHATARSRLDRETFTAVHHYCAGLIYFNRARTEKDPRQREFLLSSAIGETQYTFERSPKGSPLHGQIVSTLAMIERERGKTGVARDYLESAIKADPASPAAYVTLAIMQRDTKDLTGARKTLEAGNAATEGGSLDLAYNLGLICFELGDFDCAVIQANKVYAAEYPLPGLRNKLATNGLWPE